MEPEDTFGAWLKRRRRALDLTQEELAQQVGYSVATIRKVERGDRRPSKQLAENLAVLLGVPADEMANFVVFARAEPYLDETASPPAPTDPSPWKRVHRSLTTSSASVDWGEAPDVEIFYGRQRELAETRSVAGS